MFVKIEPTGTCKLDNFVQIRLSMYLDEGDYGYEKHHVQVPVASPDDDKKLSEMDSAEAKKFIESLPKVWQLNPFHNHFITVKPELSNDEIMDIAEAFLNEAGVKWSQEKELDLKNPSVYGLDTKFIIPCTCEDRIASLISSNLVRSIR